MAVVKLFSIFLSQLRFPILLLLLPPPVPAFFFFFVCLSILTPGFYKRFKILILCVFGDNDHGFEIFIRGGSEGVCVIQGSELMRLALELVWFGLVGSPYALIDWLKETLYVVPCRVVSLLVCDTRLDILFWGWIRVCSLFKLFLFNPSLLLSLFLLKKGKKEKYYLVRIVFKGNLYVISEYQKIMFISFILR